MMGSSMHISKFKLLFWDQIKVGISGFLVYACHRPYIARFIVFRLHSTDYGFNGWFMMGPRPFYIISFKLRCFMV